MRTLTLILLFALAPLFAHAGSDVSVHWTPPTQNTDGSALTNLAGFKIFWAGAGGNFSQYLPGAGLTTATITPQPAGTYSFSVTAVTSDGVSSDPSNTSVATTTATETPPPVQLLTASPYSYESTGTAAAPTMSAIGLIDAGLACGPVARVVGNVKFCQITRAQTDLIGWPVDKTLKNGLWARAQ